MVGFTAEEKRRFVLEYLDQPHGNKAKWLGRQEFTYSMFHRWRLA